MYLDIKTFHLYRNGHKNTEYTNIHNLKLPKKKRAKIVTNFIG